MDTCAAVRDCSGVASLQHEFVLDLDFECSSGGDVCQLFHCQNQILLVTVSGVVNTTSCFKSFNAYNNCVDCNVSVDISTFMSLLCAAAQNCANCTVLEDYLLKAFSDSGYNCGAVSEGKMLIVPSPSEKLTGEQEQEFV